MAQNFESFQSVCRVKKGFGELILSIDLDVTKQRHTNLKCKLFFGFTPDFAFENEAICTLPVITCITVLLCINCLKLLS